MDTTQKELFSMDIRILPQCELPYFYFIIDLFFSKEFLLQLFGYFVFNKIDLC